MGALIAYASSFDAIGVFSTTIRDNRFELWNHAGYDEFEKAVFLESQ